jgi:serine protease Do
MGSNSRETLCGSSIRASAGRFEAFAYWIAARPRRLLQIDPDQSPPKSGGILCAMCKSSHRWSVLLALPLLGLLSHDLAQAEEEYAKIGWWRISYREVENLRGCEAAAKFQDQTEFALSLIQGDGNKSWVVFLSNPQWVSWIAKKKRHLLSFAPINPTRLWQDAWSVDDSNRLYLPARVELINSIADADGLAVLDVNKRLLTNINMKDSELAIKAVVNCVRDHSSAPPATQNQPRAQTSSSFGTAFFVSPTFLVTNNHVVKGCGSDIRVRYPNSEWHAAAISGRDEANDLALLHTDLESLGIASFRLQSQVGETVAAYGFPYAGLLSSSGNFTTGTLSALSGMNDDSRFVQTSAPVQPGNSGGPLLDMSGNIVGVVEGQLNALTMMQFAESVPQNVNFAIQSTIVVNFLAARNQTPKSDSSVTRPDLPPAEVADLAKKFTVQVHCGAGSTETAENSTIPPQKPTPPPAPPSAATSTLEQRAKDFVLSLQDLWSRQNSENFAALDDFYEDEVMYYGKKITKEAVLKEKRAFATRFPQREYKAREPISVWCGDDICTVHGLVDYRAIDPAAHFVSSGVATFDYRLSMLKTKPKIKMENGEVLSRTRTPLSPTSVKSLIPP